MDGLAIGPAFTGPASQPGLRPLGSPERLLIAAELAAEPGTDIAGPGEDAIEVLFRDAYPGLVGWVRRLVDDDDTAHDIASEAFVRLLSRWTRVHRPHQYLYVIAANLIRDHWRKASRERRALRCLAAGAVTDPVTCPTQDVDVRGFIASLPSRLYDPFLLYYYGALGIRETAALLSRPEGTIKADLFAARAQLKTALAEGDG
jgi:RNA polymerase sigma-70 factor (ECF subfamily)